MISRSPAIHPRSRHRSYAADVGSLVALVFGIFHLSSPSFLRADDSALVDDMAEVVDAVHEARLDDAITLVENNPELRRHEWARYVWGRALEFQGRDDEALEVYLDWMRESSPDRFPLPLRYGDPHEASVSQARFQYHFIQEEYHIAGRITTLSIQGGDEAWQRMLELRSETRGAPPSFSDWKQAQWGNWRGGGDDFDFLKRNPTNEVAMRRVYAGMDRWDFADALLRRHPEMSLDTEVLLRCRGAKRSPGSGNRDEKIVSWLDALNEGSPPIQDKKALAVALWALVDFPDSIGRLVAKQRKADLPDDDLAELLMFHAYSCFKAGERETEGIELANEAVALWKQATPDFTPLDRLRRGPAMPWGEARWISFEDWHRPFYETVPGGFRLLKNPEVTISDVAALNSPLLRVIRLAPAEAWKELEKERDNLSDAAVRDIRRFLWYSAPNDAGEAWTQAKQDCEEAAQNAPDRIFAFEAAVALDQQLWQGLRSHPDYGKRKSVPRAAYDELRDKAAALRAFYPDDRPAVERLLRRCMSQVLYHHRSEFGKKVKAASTHRSTEIDHELWLKRGRVASGTGLSDLEARLRHLDADAPGEESLELVRRIHAAYPHRDIWAVEFALRMHDESEAFTLLDERLADDAEERRALVLATSFLRLEDNPWPEKSRDAVARRLTRWDRARHPRGDRRWLREIIPMLVAYTPGHEAWEWLFDGRGTAEGAYDILWEQWERGGATLLADEARLDLARRVLLSGSYREEEDPWINRARFFGRKELPRPHTRRGTAKALRDLMEAATDLGYSVIFPPDFMGALHQVDPVTATWLEQMARGERPPSRYLDDDWFCIGQGPGREPLAPNYRPPGPEYAVLKFSVAWHERTRHELAQVFSRED